MSAERKTYKPTGYAYSAAMCCGVEVAFRSLDCLAGRTVSPFPLMRKEEGGSTKQGSRRPCTPAPIHLCVMKLLRSIGGYPKSVVCRLNWGLFLQEIGFSTV